MPERMTAKKVRISDIVNGEWVQQDGMEPSYVVSKTGEMVSRARVMATVVSKFSSDDGNFGSLTLDDGTDTMRAKSFKDLTVMKDVENGQLVDVISKVREYNGEVYLIPELITKVGDPNALLLRKLEIVKRLRQVKDSGEAKEISGGDAKEEGKGEDLRDKVLGIISDSKDGIEYAKLIEQSGSTEEKVEKVVNDLLSEGICYEPTPGKIKKI